MKVLAFAIKNLLLVGIILSSSVATNAIAEDGAALLGSVADVAGKLRLTNLPAPVTVSAGRMEFDYDDGLLLYTGNVEVDHAGMQLKAKELSIEFEPGAKKALRKMVAKGNVVVTRGEERATGGLALYDPAKATVTLSENAKLTSGPNSIEGPRVIIYLDERRASVEGSASAQAEPGSDGSVAPQYANGRVRVVLVPESLPTQKSPSLDAPAAQAADDAIDAIDAIDTSEPRIEEVEGAKPVPTTTTTTTPMLPPDQGQRRPGTWNRAPR